MNTDQKRKKIGRKRRATGWTLLTLGLLVAAVWVWLVWLALNGNWSTFADYVALVPLPIVLWTAAALFFRSALRAAPRVDPNLCRSCGYAITGLPPAGMCPECGHDPHDPAVSDLDAMVNQELARRR